MKVMLYDEVGDYMILKEEYGTLHDAFSKF